MSLQSLLCLTAYLGKDTLGLWASRWDWTQHKQKHRFFFSTSYSSHASEWVLFLILLRRSHRLRFSHLPLLQLEHKHHSTYFKGYFHMGRALSSGKQSQFVLKQPHLITDKYQILCAFLWSTALLMDLQATGTFLQNCINPCKTCSFGTEINSFSQVPLGKNNQRHEPVRELLHHSAREKIK